MADLARIRHRFSGGVCAAVALLCCACTGTIQRSAESENASGGAYVGASDDDGRGSATPASGSAGTAGSKPIDVNRVGIHRLNNTEYDNTVRDLLGVSDTPARNFIADEKALGFDNIAEALGMTDAQYEQYWNAADALSERVFADAALRARIMTCEPAAADDAQCTRSIIAGFGKRAWRRPLTDAEIERLTQLAGEATALGEDFAGSIRHVAKALLLSVPFLYRVELDPDPEASASHPLDAYELASRLSYLVWSTMPDSTLIDVADSGELLDTGELTAQLRRMLTDPRGQRFVQGFAGQWLGLRDLEGHQVEPTAFPEFDDDLRTAMISEGYRYFAQFVQGERSLQEFFTADVNFVDGPLARLYGFSAQTFDPGAAFHDTSDARRGFLGLASFLTLTSYSYRTAPTLRGKWVLQNLLCEEIPPPPPNVPKLDDSQADSAAAQSLNVRERLAEHRKNPQCASCHTILDPIGLGLENFDAIGRYRTRYVNGDTIDASGMLPSGEAFDGLDQLSQVLAGDPRLVDCASEKLLTYALSRRIVEADQPYLQALRTQWKEDGLSIAALLRDIVVSEPFRSRRGEAAP
jgi:hypothetical protein